MTRPSPDLDLDLDLEWDLEWDLELYNTRDNELDNELFDSKSDYFIAHSGVNILPKLRKK